MTRFGRMEVPSDVLDIMPRKRPGSPATRTGLLVYELEPHTQPQGDPRRYSNHPDVVLQYDLE